MNVYLFSYQKKKNSTATPALNTGTQFTVRLKEETSLLEPALIFNPASSGMPDPFTPTYFTYCYIQNFERYYFITDWQYLNATWICYLAEDVLASFKNTIGTESFYVERSSYSYNGHLVDTLYPAKTDVTITNATIATDWNGVAPSGGSYILGVINYQNSNHIGAVTYYALTTANLNNMMNFLFSSDIFNASSITEIGEDLYKSLFNPFQYVVSCMWLPGSPSFFGSSTSTIKVGYWDTNITAYLVNAIAEVKFVTGTIPDHPQISRGAYLNFAPYTRITMFLPPFGEVPLDPTFTRVGKYLYAKVIVDPVTGQATLRAAFSSQSTGNYTGKACVEKTAMFGVPIQLAQILSDYSGAINTLASGLTGGIAGIVTGAIGATVQTAIASQAPKVTTNGANGSFINFALEPALIVEHYKIADEDLADLGRPLMAKTRIDTIPGYIKCAEAHFSGSCLDSERDQINSFLLSGFFYE